MRKLSESQKSLRRQILTDYIATCERALRFRHVSDAESTVYNLKKDECKAMIDEIDNGTDNQTA